MTTKPTAIHVDPKTVQHIIRATFPGYTGRMAQIEPRESITLHSLNWSGGSRSTYRACRLDGTPMPSRVDMSAPAPWENPYEGAKVNIPEGVAIVEHVIFCGKDIGMHIYARPENVAPLIPAPVELAPHERLVLAYTIGRKASYNGKDRYSMAQEDQRYTSTECGQALKGPPFPSRPEWETAKAALIARGFLNKAGAVTSAGRNAWSATK